MSVAKRRAQEAAQRQKEKEARYKVCLWKSVQHILYVGECNAVSLRNAHSQGLQSHSSTQEYKAANETGQKQRKAALLQCRMCPVEGR